MERSNPVSELTSIDSQLCKWNSTHTRTWIVITQCSIRHLYSLNSPDIPPSLKETLIATAKTMERRRCNHHELDEPLSSLKCISSVIDPKGSGTNKNRYVLASQEEELRRFCRSLKGVPLIYIKRSVMVMEPMSEESIEVRESTEKEKFRQGLRGRVAGLGKRKRENEDTENSLEINDAERKVVMGGQELSPKKKRTRGPKGPNPLSVKKKPKMDVTAKAASLDAESRAAVVPQPSVIDEDEASVRTLGGGEMEYSHPLNRKKMRRRQKHNGNDEIPSAGNGESDSVRLANKVESGVET